MPAHSSQKGRHKMARPDARQSALTGHPAADGSVNGTTCLPGLQALILGWRNAATCSPSVSPSKSASLSKEASRAYRTNVPSPIDYVSPIVAFRLTSGSRHRESRARSRNLAASYIGKALFVSLRNGRFAGGSVHRCHARH